MKKSAGLALTFSALSLFAEPVADFTIPYESVKVEYDSIADLKEIRRLEKERKEQRKKTQTQSSSVENRKKKEIKPYTVKEPIHKDIGLSGLDDKRTEKFLDYYLSDKGRKKLADILIDSAEYRHYVRQQLAKKKMPSFLQYLPIVESEYKANAVSVSGATGLWQFMAATGKRYGLRINSMIDERRDPTKASYAAANYLSDLYSIFGDWNLVIAAYNAGPDNITKAIHRAKGVKDYWHIYPYLPKETRGYVPAFIAANYVMSYYCDHNICPMETKLPVKTDTIMVDRDVRFEQITHFLDIPQDQLATLNPQYRHNIVNGANKLSSIRLPETMVTTFIDNQDSIYAYVPENVTSKRSEVAVNTIEPASSGSKKSSSKSRKRSSKTKGKSITIRQGDTLSEIAARNHTTVAKLKKLNKISGTSIRAGKKLRVR